MSGPERITSLIPSLAVNGDVHVLDLSAFTVDPQYVRLPLN